MSMARAMLQTREHAVGSLGGDPVLGRGIGDRRLFICNGRAPCNVIPYDRERPFVIAISYIAKRGDKSSTHIHMMTRCYFFGSRNHARTTLGVVATPYSPVLLVGDLLLNEFTHFRTSPRRHDRCPQRLPRHGKIHHSQTSPLNQSSFLPTNPPAWWTTTS